MFKDDFSAQPPSGQPWRETSGTVRPHGRWRQRVSAALKAAWHEPLTHFVLLGIAIFIAAHAIEAHSRRYVIAITPGDVTRITNSYSQQYGSPPAPDQLRQMLDNYVREEIFLREGLALGLDRNDEIVRRRVAQKFEFLQADMAVPREPTEPELQAWFTQHRAQFVAPARRGFDQIFFSADQRGDGAARGEAARALAALPTANGATNAVGDDFPGPKVVAGISQDDVQRVFGGGDFAKAVFAAQPGQWVGPLRSGFGWHLIRVTAVTPAHPRNFAEAKGDARIVWQQADRDARNAETYRTLRARHAVRVEDGR